MGQSNKGAGSKNQAPSKKPIESVQPKPAEQVAEVVKPAEPQEPLKPLEVPPVPTESKDPVIKVKKEVMSGMASHKKFDKFKKQGASHDQ
jgi:hypothetical protein